MTREQATRPKSDVNSTRQQSIKEMRSMSLAGSPKVRDDSERSSENYESDIPSEQWSDTPGIQALQVFSIVKLNKKENRRERENARIRNKNNENSNGKLCTAYN